MIKLKVTSRLLLRNGDYTGFITDGMIKTVFDKTAVAKSTTVAMKANKEVFDYDGERTITQMFPGMYQEELLLNSVGLLESAKQHMYPTQKLQWEIIREV